MISTLSHWWSSWPGHVLKLFFSLCLVGILLWQVALDALWEAMRQADPALVILAIGVVILGVVVLQSVEIHKSITLRPRPSVARLAQINLTMMFYSFFLPAALTFAVRWSKYRKLGLEGWHSAALVGVHKLLQLMVALLFFLGAYVLSPLATHPLLDTMLSGLAIATLVLMMYFTYLAASKRERTLPNSPAQWLGGPSRKGVSSRFGKIFERLWKIIERLSQAMLTFRHLQPKEKLWCLALAVLQHLCIITSAYLVMIAIAPETSWLSVILIRSLLVVLLTLPISVAGIGVRELIFFALFPFYGVSAEVALAGSLILLGIQLIIALLGATFEAFAAWRGIRLSSTGDEQT